MEGILILNTQEDDIDYETSRKITLTVMRSLLFLAFNTDFFGTQFDREKNYDAYLVKEMAKDPNIIFAGQLMVRLAMIVRINSTTVKFCIHIFQLNSSWHFGPFCYKKLLLFSRHLRKLQKSPKSHSLQHQGLLPYHCWDC